jgi:WD40 repeat protein
MVLAAVDALGQERRGRANRGGGSSGGYGRSSNDRGTPAARGGREGGSRTAAGTSDDEELKYPTRARPAGGTLSEYQKPSYDHHRFVVSPDGTRIAISGRHVQKENAGTPNEKTKRDSSGKPIVIENVLEVIEAASGQQIALFKPPAVFDNLAISPDNQFLAAEVPDRPGVVYALHLPTRKSKELKTDLRRIVAGGMVFSKDSRSIHLVAPDRLITVALGNGESKELKYEIPSPYAVYSAETNLLAVGVVRSKQGRPELQIYDVATGKQTEQLATPSAPTCLGFSPDGAFLAATVVGGSIRAWQTSDWTVTATVAARIGYQPGQLAVSAEAQHVAVRPKGSGRDEMRVIDLGSGETVQSIDTRDVFFMPSGTLAIANNAGPFYLEVGGGSITEYPGGDAAIVQASDSGEADADAATASASPQGGYGLPSREAPVRVGYGLPAASREAAAPPVEETPAPAEPAAPVIVGYGAPSGGEQREILPRGLPQRRGGQWMSLASEQLPPRTADSSEPRPWDATQGSMDVAVSGDGGRIACIKRYSLDGIPRIRYSVFDVKTGELLGNVGGSVLKGLSWSANGEYLVARLQDEQISIIHIPTQRSSYVAGPSAAGRNVAISDDGQTIYTEHGSSVGITHFMADGASPNDSGAAQNEPKLIKLPGEPTPLAFWPERKEVVGASAAVSNQSRPTLAIFALPDNKPIKTVELPAPATTIGYSPDGKFLAVGMKNGQISVFTTSAWTAAVNFDGGDPAGYRNIAISSGAKFVAANPADPNNGGLMMWRVIGGRKLPRTLFSTGHAFVNETVLAKAAPDAPILFHDLQSNRDVWPWEKPGDAATETADASAEEAEPAPPVKIVTGYGASEADKIAAKEREEEERRQATQKGRR